MDRQRIVVWFVTTPFVDWFLLGKYEVSKPMIVAAILAGLSKILASFGSAIVTAIGTPLNLKQLRNQSWFAVGAALLGAAIGARYGLAGVLFGVAGGWLVHAMRVILLARRIFSAQTN